MKKGVALLLVALLIVGAIVFVMMRVHYNLGADVVRTADSFIPEKSDFILQENDERGVLLFSDFLGGALDKSSETFLLQNIDTLFTKGIIESRKAKRVAILDSTNSYIAVYKSKGALNKDLIFRCFESQLGDISVVDKDVVIYTTKDSMHYVSGVGEWLLISNSSTLIKESITYSPRRDSVGMAPYCCHVGEDATVNLYVNKSYAQSEIVMDLYLAEDNSTLLGQGYSSINEESWYNALGNQISDYSSFDTYFPESTIAAEWIVVDNLKGFINDIQRSVAQDSNVLSFANFVNRCDTLLNGNVAQVICDECRFLLLGVKESWGVGKLLEDMYGAKEGISVAVQADKLFGPLFSKGSYSLMTLSDNYIVMAASKSEMSKFSSLSKKSILNQEWYKSYKKQAPSRFSFTQFIYADRLFDVYKGDERGLAHKMLSAYSGKKLPMGALGVQGEYVSGKLFMSVIGTSNRERKTEQQRVVEKQAVTQISTKNGTTSASVGPKGDWKRELLGSVIKGPIKVVNYNDKSTEWLVQDSKSRLYLFNSAGKKLWSATVEGPIISDIVQVDRYKNGRLQYIFSTKRKIYLVDRNGTMVQGYPIVLKSDCTEGISVCDYEKDKTYRVFVPKADRSIDLYDIEGKRVSGWSSPKTTSTIVSRVEHFRVSGKDYIVVADKSKLYIYDRRGNVRVNCAKKFALAQGTRLSLTKRSGKSVICVKSGKALYYIDFTGKEVK